uniref:Uncharacterized protein n=1 Tax=viral metagenome TaxID=1070528 RepID=A0A6C0DQT4_9ZZZZ
MDSEYVEINNIADHDDIVDEKMDDVDLTDDNTLEVNQLIEIKKIFDNYSTHWHSKEYNEIVEKVNKYLLQFCNHTKETDLFDITPEKSMTVCYCTRCYCVFDDSK